MGVSTWQHDLTGAICGREGNYHITEQGYSSTRVFKCQTKFVQTINQNTVNIFLATEHKVGRSPQ